MARKEELERMWKRTVDYLFNQRPAFERQGAHGYKPGLGTSIALAKLYKEPYQQYRTIHIAGTNGKGSTAHMLASCLQKCGYRVGLFTSPHMVDFRERIRVNGRKISRNFVMQWVAEYKKNKQKLLEDLEPSFFELTSTMAFDYFAWRHVNVAVIETGLGGRLDSTNIITPDLSIITNIGLEHQQFLGDTLADIAREKAGIIKHGQPVVIGHAYDIVRMVFERMAKRLYSDITFAEDDPQVISAKHVNGMLQLNTRDYGIVNCDLTGDYQVENVNTVLTALNVLKQGKYRITEQAIKEGLAHVAETTGLIGRWMKLGEKPLIICDSAHNVAGITQAMQQLTHEEYDQLHMVMGFMADKDVEGILQLLPTKATYYFTQAQTPRALPVQDLLPMAKKHRLKGTTYNNVSEALDAARDAAHPRDMIYIGGSMYVLAELFQAIYKDKD